MIKYVFTFLIIMKNLSMVIFFTGSNFWNNFIFYVAIQIIRDTFRTFLTPAPKCHQMSHVGMRCFKRPKCVTYYLNGLLLHGFIPSGCHQMSHRGLRCIKREPKKCHKLFEWPLLKDGTNDHILWQDRWQIFQGMNDKINTSFLEFNLKFFREQALLPDLVQGHVQDLVT